MRYRHAYALICLLAASLAFCQADSPGAPPATVHPGAVRADEPRSDSERLGPAPTTLSADQIKDLIRQAAEKDIQNEKKQKDYNYTERVEENKLDGKGGTKSTEIRVYDVLQIYGEEAERLISKDGKPLPDKESKKEDEKIQKMIDKRKNESDSEREKRLKKEEKDRARSGVRSGSCRCLQLHLPRHGDPSGPRSLRHRRRTSRRLRTAHARRQNPPQIPLPLVA